MIHSFSYATWRETFSDNERIESPISFTLDGLQAILNDPIAAPERRAAARDFLKKLKKKTYLSDAIAAFCAIGAAVSSIAYFMAMRDNPLEAGPWLIVPIIAGIFVAGAAWYTYHHDTAELLLDPSHTHKKWSSKSLGLMLMTGFVLAMELALAGYGVYKCLDVMSLNIQIGVIAAVCLTNLIPEWAQTYKYLEKWIDSDEKYHLKFLQDWRFAGYMACSVIMLLFSGMAIFPLLEKTFTVGIALPMIAAYVILGLPCLWKKAEAQLTAQNNYKGQSSSKMFTGVRIGNGLGDLAFAAFGFFETMKALHLIKKPRDIFSGLDDSFNQALQPWGIVLLGLLVAASTCVGSYLLSTKGDEESYGSRINHIIGSPSLPTVPADKNIFHIWRKKSDTPSVETIQSPSPALKSRI